MLTVEKLSYSYGAKRVLSDLSFSLPSGKIGVVLGKNGAGKSTLFKCVLGILKGTGKITLDGVDLAAASRRERARLVAYVPQESSFGELTVREAVTVGRLAHFGLTSTARDREVVENALTELGISGLADRSVNTLSGGERQKVAIARALAQEAKLLIFDEPTGNLDIGSERLLFDLAKRIVGERGVSVLIAVHNLHFAIEFGDLFYMMKGGALLRASDAMTEENVYETFGVRTRILSVDDAPVIVYRR